MPKVNLCKVPSNPLVEMIFGRMRVLGMSYEEAGAPVMSAATLCRRLKKDPTSFSLRELGHLSRKLDIPVERMRENIRF